MKKLCILVFMFLCALQINSMAQGGTAISISDSICIRRWQWQVLAMTT